ncbi:GNAT family N-acetyltransferase [Pseudoalteromonas luteoviolacea]|uniref:N-acetyltransferase domain-containing protein n=1 Tax=Pseudoalteromonas luteoviolacea H33 TaxID=1365251 RepID=A0A167DTL8_9GAMM|nr:GNAT family N-acetyltransferase [Pseudoalteromonas luteoviolacea]KZN49337.1 hypothetical protein N476_20010 [Pseudoalteromonas luteoviolacea H33]KZN74859.1 hypothetical protein N477_20775 [Pseudoalteromonas luteoviolacea H33-S]MBQ4878308.1 GNAT family N-acetyltransferase [Pseudoalteromonas luteoviolacea]MBQ4907463.1 GNAT family N-acetyltransferase [Pseudoalteromonas luteoviolacea]
MNWSIEQGSIDEVIEIENQVPEFVTPKTRALIEARLKNKKTLLLVAKADGQPVAYKLGYALDEKHFYSWLGAVIPEFREAGIAQALLNEQERWCTSLGYEAIGVKSMNRFKNMLMMLLKNNYQIVACHPLEDGTDSKIHFLKQL